MELPVTERADIRRIGKVRLPARFVAGTITALGRMSLLVLLLAACAGGGSARPPAATAPQTPIANAGTNSAAGPAATTPAEPPRSVTIALSNKSPAFLVS